MHYGNDSAERIGMLTQLPSYMSVGVKVVIKRMSIQITKIKF